MQDCSENKNNDFVDQSKVSQMFPWFTGDPNSFLFKLVKYSGDTCVLIIPSGEKTLGAWFENDKVYRSSIWTLDGKVVSPGYRKFVNFEEQPTFEPVNPLSSNYIAVEKIDGSCLICSKYKDSYIFRTRGTTDAHTMPNGDEIDGLIEKYNVKSLLNEYNGEVTFLFEWVTPTNILCVKFYEPDLILTGAIKHKFYNGNCYFKQGELDELAKTHGLKRPKTFSDFHGTATETRKDILDWVNAEGVVCYFNEDSQNGPTLKKMKSQWHYNIHCARIYFSNKSKVFDWMNSNELLSENTTDEDIKNKLAKDFEWEVVEYSIGTCLTILNLYKNIHIKNIEHVKELLDGITEIKDVLKVIDENKDIPQCYFWNTFKNRNTYKPSFIKEIIFSTDENII